MQVHLNTTSAECMLGAEERECVMMFQKTSTEVWECVMMFQKTSTEVWECVMMFQKTSTHFMIAVRGIRRRIYVLCLISSVNGTRKQKKQKIQKINVIGLQNNHHPSQHTVGNVHKAS
jgi:hypothetical protein